MDSATKTEFKEIKTELISIDERFNTVEDKIDILITMADKTLGLFKNLDIVRIKKFIKLPN